MVERLSISRLGSAGDGIAETEHGPVHVPYALPGEIVLAEGDGGKRRLVEIENRSPDRIEPFCEHYFRCGGCVFQHLSENAYVTWKRDKVADALRREGLDVPVELLRDAHGAGRRRVVLHVREIEGDIRAGFMEAGTHHLVPIEHCPITVPALRRAAEAATGLGRLAMGGGKPIDVAVTSTGGGLDVDLRGGGRPPEPLVQSLIKASQEFDLARLSVHGQALIERRAPTIPLGSGITLPPPGSFLQATEKGEEVLASLVVAAAEGARRIVDLFSGVGPFALRLAERAEVHAVEGQEPMLAALDRSARRTAGLRRVTTETRDLFRRPLLAPEFERFDLIVLDPPRQGAEAQVKQIASSSSDRVIMVSCDARTFARDAATLVAAGFSLAPVVPVDQFKWSAHVEIVGVFTRKREKRARARRR